MEKKKDSVTREEGSIGKAEMKKVSEMITDINGGKAEGFFMVVKKSESEDETVCEGNAKVHHMGKYQILDVFLRSFGLNKDAVKKWLMIQEFGEMVGDK